MRTLLFAALFGLATLFATPHANAAPPDKVTHADAAAPAATDNADGYVFLGKCEQNVLASSNVEGIKACDVVDVEATAIRGLKLRAALPERSTFGAEVGRLKRQERFHILSLHNVGDGFMWAKVSRLAIDAKADARARADL